MIFTEKLTLWILLKSIGGRKTVFFFQMTPFVSIFSKIIQRSKWVKPCMDNITEFGWGDTEYLGKACRLACKNAEHYKEKFLNKSTGPNGSNKFGIDFQLILKKFILCDLLYQKYFFYELSLQYASENKQFEYIFYLEKTNLWFYQSQFENIGKISFIKSRASLEYIASILIVPAFFLYWAAKKIRTKVRSFNNQVVCVPTVFDEYLGYRNIFQGIEKLKYQIQPVYLEMLPYKQYEILKPYKADGYVHISALVSLVKGLIAFLIYFVRESKNYFWMGLNIVRLLKIILYGRSLAPTGRGNHYLYCEHHDINKTVRNEFIRSEGSRSVIFSFLQGFSLQYYPQEYFKNYDYSCVSGPHLREHYKNSFASVSNIIKSGSYVANKDLKNDNGRTNRVEELKAQKGKYVAVTILCPGVCKPTYQSEVKLLLLAKRLSRIDNVKVFIREKPFTPEDKYRNFYQSAVKGESRIHLSGGEFKLYDFLDVSDLFITSYSTSACEVACRGGAVYFVDFLKQPDRFLFWKESVSKDLLLTEDTAFEQIKAWIEDTPSGDVRRQHNTAMKRFVKYLEYPFTDFGEYQKNLLMNLRNEKIL